MDFSDIGNTFFQFFEIYRSAKQVTLQTPAV